LRDFFRTIAFHWCLALSWSFSWLLTIAKTIIKVKYIVISSNKLSLDTILRQIFNIVHEIYIHTQIVAQILVSFKINLAEKYHKDSRFRILDFW
jgi:hypothetical protein